MIETIIFIFNSAFIGLLLAIPTALIDFGLIKIGVVRNRIGILILGVFFLVFVKRIWFDALSWNYVGPLTVSFGIFAINRGDFWTTICKGRWWWKAEKQL